ncbi:MAG: RNA polymerase sigma factor [Gammaproteobacteria bacterium]
MKVNDKADKPETIGTYLRLYQRLKVYVARRVGCPDTAEDIVQDAYLRIAVAAEASVSAPDAYVYRVAGNLVLDYRRRLSRRGEGEGIEVLLEMADPEPPIEARLGDQARLRRVLEIASGFPPRCKEVFVLRQLEGLEHAEIAERLGISRNMVEKHLRRALCEISEKLETE